MNKETGSPHEKKMSSQKGKSKSPSLRVDEEIPPIPGDQTNEWTLKHSSHLKPSRLTKIRKLGNKNAGEDEGKWEESSGRVRVHLKKNAVDLREISLRVP